MYDNHPYEYAYFNEINGGVKGANGYYETDYQQLGASASFNWLVNSKEFLKDTTSNKIIQTNNIALKYADLNFSDSIQFEEASFIRLTFRPMNYAIISSMFIEKNLVQNFILQTEQYILKKLMEFLFHVLLNQKTILYRLE